MAWIIDEFGCKPSGFLAGWQYGRVYVDENGNVTHGDVPGKDGFGRQCIDDYKKNDRRYSDGQLITEFCNLETHTFYRAYAMNCRPFAYTEADINAPRCGYEEPLPEPAVPPNPFGNPNYGLYRTFEFCDEYNVPCKVSIEMKNYTGAVIPLEIGDASPVKLNYKIVDYKFDPIRPIECTLSFVVGDNFLLNEFYTNDERTFRVTVEKDSKVEFKGYIIPDTCAEPFEAPPYAVSIRATDAIGGLKAVTYPVPVGSDIDISQSFVDVLAYCFAMTNLNLNIATICNLYDVSMPNAIDNDPMAMATINPLRLSKDNNTVLSVYDVLVNVAKAWGAYIVQSSGSWCFVRVNELANSAIRMRLYNYKGLYLRSQNLDNQRTIGGSVENIIVSEGGEISIQNAYKRIVVESVFGSVPSLIYNGDFEQWDGHNFNYWTRYGGFDFSRVKRTVTNSSGEKIPIENYAIRFNVQADSGKFLRSNAIPVQKNDTLKLQYRVDTTDTSINTEVSMHYTKTYTTYCLIKLRVVLSIQDENGVVIKSYWLANPDNGTNFQWNTSLSYVGNKVENSKGDINNFSVNFQIPECPESGLINIELYGAEYFSSVDQVGTLEGSPDFGVHTGSTIKGPYSKTTIDDISVSKSSQNSDNDMTGLLSVSENLAYHTENPEKTEILFGDYYPPQGAQLLNSLYAIKVGNKTTTGWYEYGITSGGVPFGLALAKSILRAYQKPFRLYNGELRLKPGQRFFNYLDTFSFNIPHSGSFNNKLFSIMGGDFDLKYNSLSNVVLAELFDKPARSQDITTPSYPGGNEPVFTQDPNYNNNVFGIFTEEFTEQFK
ncbi:MAG: hypothetical protein J7577_00895 [Sphingobacteriaceae bacterium]|nr:hypothetical protein [Sphingobacteriaceae bacterium]